MASDGNYYRANMHCGNVSRNGDTGIPFYKAGKLSKEKIDKIFGGSK